MELEETISLTKELHRYSIINGDTYYSEKLLEIIINLSTMNTSLSTNSDEIKYQNEIDKVKRKVPKWMKKTNQYNYRILRAFIELSDYNKNRVAVDELEKNVDIGEAFLANYNNLKTISEKNHAKVFDEIDKKVELWEPVTDFIIEKFSDYDRYFGRLIATCEHRDNKLSVNLSHSRGKSYITFVYEQFKYSVVLVSKRAKAYGTDFSGLVVELYFDGQDHETNFRKLSQYRNEIEDELNPINIVWQPSEETVKKSVCRIYAQKSVDINDITKWNEYMDWQVNSLIKFLEVFPKYTKN